MSRAREARAARRASQFAKFRVTELNLVPLVDTLVSIVFFAITTQTVGELSKVIPGVNLPSSIVGTAAHDQLTLGISNSTITLGENPVMGTGQAAQAQSDMPNQPLVVPALYAVLRATADSIRRAHDIPAGQSVTTPLAIQGDREMPYVLMSRMIQTARVAGFNTLTLQVNKTEVPPAIAGN